MQPAAVRCPRGGGLKHVSQGRAWNSSERWSVSGSYCFVTR